MRIRNSLFSVLPTLFRAAFQLLIQKHVAWSFGPSGVFVFGQISSVASFTNSLALGGAGNGLIVSMTKKEPKNLSSLDIASIGTLFLTGLLMVAFASFFLVKTNYLIAWDAASKAYTNLLFGMVILSYLGFSIFTFANSVLIGSANLRVYFYIGSATVLLAIVLYLILLTVTQSHAVIYFVPFVYSLAALICTSFWRLSWWRLANPAKFSLKEFYHVLRALFSQSAMTVLSSVTTPITALYILYLVSSNLSSAVAGELYALTKITDIFTIFLGPLIANRIYPTITNWKYHRPVLRAGIKKSIILFLIMLILLQVGAFFSDDLFRLLFSSDFSLDEKIVRIYFLGDSFKLLLTCLAYFVISANALKVYVLMDLVQKIALLLLVNHFINIYGLLGYTVCYTITIFLTLVCTALWIFKRPSSFNLSNK